jgi:hypothetical protein
MRITPTPESTSAADALETTKDAVTAFYGPMVVYCNPTRVATAMGLAPAYEGEISDPDTGSAKRFGVSALADSGSKMTFLLFGPRNKLLSEFERLLRSVRFAAGPPGPAIGAAQNLVQRRADSVLFDVHSDWSFPTTLLFADPHMDDVRLRLTLDEPMAQEGYLDPAAEIPAVPGDGVTVLRHTVTPGRPNANSWTGEWTVEHTSPLGKRVMILRKAGIRTSGTGVLTLHGQAMEKNAARLTTGWETILQTFREQTP